MMTGEAPALYRVGRAPDPFHAWTPGEAKNHGNRFDYPAGEFGVLYAAEQRRGAFIETLARFRPALDALGALADLPDGDYGDDTPQDAGVISNDWHLKRLVGRFRVATGQRWLDLRELATREMLRQAAAATFVSLGLTDFDLSDVITRRRDVTQASARWAYDQGYHGVIYPSRLEPTVDNWAIFEGAQLEILDISPIARDDVDLLAVAGLFNLRLAE